MANFEEMQASVMQVIIQAATVAVSNERGTPASSPTY